MVQPGVDKRRLQRALTALTARHDSLRLRFDTVKGQFRAFINPPGPAFIREMDLGELDDEALKTRLTDIASTAIPLFGHPLFELVVVHCGSRGDAVIWRAHHAITDGVGMVVLFEDLLKLLLGMPLLSKAMTYPDYVTRFMTLPPSRTAVIDAFWRKMHRDLPRAPDIGRKAKGLEPLWSNLGKVKLRRLRVSVGTDSLSKFSERVAEANLSNASVMFAGFLESLCQRYDTDRLAFTTLVARSDPALARYSGAHFFDPILPYQAVGDTAITQAAHRLRADLMQANAHLPAQAATQATAYEQALIDSGIYARQFSVHQPRPPRRKEKSTFANSYNTTPDLPKQVGPYTLTPVDVSVYLRCRTDLRILLREGQENPGFNLEYDGISYTDAEIDALSVRICELLDLDLEGACRM